MTKKPSEDAVEPSCGFATVNGEDRSVTYAEFTLFAGRLDLMFCAEGEDIEILGIPFPSAVEARGLEGLSYMNTDGTKEEIGNTSCHPRVFYKHGYWNLLEIKAEVPAIEGELASVALVLRASRIDGDGILVLRAQTQARCRPIGDRTLLGGMGPIPTRYAGHYLPMLGLPGIPEEATLDDVIGIFGQPDHSGGGSHPQFGWIPHWIRYTTKRCFLRFEMQDKLIKMVTIMSLADPPCDLK